MKVVVGGMVWLKKSDLTPDNILNLKTSLTIIPRKTFDTPGEFLPVPIKLYQEEGGLFGVPRDFYLQNKTYNHEEILDISDGKEMSSFKSLWTCESPFEEQDVAIQKLLAYTRTHAWGGGIIKAGCGSGKTLTSLEFAHRLGRRTFILVHKGFFMKQWRRRIEEFYPGATIGIVRQDECDFEKDFVIGMVESLAKDDGQGLRYPKELYSAFGLIISDEIHRTAAPTWCSVTPRFDARWRLGLTATPRRKDGTEDVFFLNIGKIIYSFITEAHKPILKRVATGSVLHPTRVAGVKIAEDNLRKPAVVKQLTEDEFRNRAIVEQILEATKVGRKVFVVSERLEHLRSLSNETVKLSKAMGVETPTYDFYTGEWFVDDGKKKRTRSEDDLDRAESAQVVFSTKQMVEEGFDLQALDVLVLTVPISDVEQVVGRVRRFCKPKEGKCIRLCPWRAGTCKEKTAPVVVDIIDVKVRQAMASWERRKKFYRSVKCLLDDKI